MSESENGKDDELEILYETIRIKDEKIFLLERQLRNALLILAAIAKKNGGAITINTYDLLSPDLLSGELRRADGWCGDMVFEFSAPTR